MFKSSLPLFKNNLDMKFRDYNNYEVFENGKIWSYKRSKFLKPLTLQSGYQMVTLTDNEGKKKSYYVHRVVYEAVTGEQIPEGYEINHISEAKDENFFENLQLLTHKQNINYGSRTERSAKAHSKQVGAFKNNELVMTFTSTIEAERNGFESSSVVKCCNGKLKTHKGFEWRYL